MKNVLIVALISLFVVNSMAAPKSKKKNEFKDPRDK